MHITKKVVMPLAAIPCTTAEPWWTRCEHTVIATKTVTQHDIRTVTQPAVTKTLTQPVITKTLTLPAPAPSTTTITQPAVTKTLTLPAVTTTLTLPAPAPSTTTVTQPASTITLPAPIRPACTPVDVNVGIVVKFINNCPGSIFDNSGSLDVAAVEDSPRLPVDSYASIGPLAVDGGSTETVPYHALSVELIFGMPYGPANFCVLQDSTGLKDCPVELAAEGVTNDGRIGFIVNQADTFTISC